MAKSSNNKKGVNISIRLPLHNYHAMFIWRDTPVFSKKLLKYQNTGKFKYRIVDFVYVNQVIKSLVRTAILFYNTYFK